MFTNLRNSQFSLPRQKIFPLLNSEYTPKKLLQRKLQIQRKEKMRKRKSQHMLVSQARAYINKINSKRSFLLHFHTGQNIYNSDIKQIITKKKPTSLKRLTGIVQPSFEYTPARCTRRQYSELLKPAREGRLMSLPQIQPAKIEGRGQEGERGAHKQQE